MVCVLCFNVVVIEVVINEGFQVVQLNWMFENLKIVGVCNNDEYCEYVFYIVGMVCNIIICNN